MDSIVHSALEEICCEAANGLHLSGLWTKLSPSLAARGMPICPNVKRALWENLVEIPGLKLVADIGVASSMPSEDLIKCSVEECEKLNVKIVAPEAMRKSFLGIYEMETSESSLSDTQRLVLERLAIARNNGIAQNELSKELRIPGNNLFYQLKKLETQGLIVRQQSVIRKKQASCNKEQKSGSIVSTNMLYLYRYGKHLSSQQRLEITKEEQLLMDGEAADGHTETGDDFGKEISTENVLVKDFIPALKAICDKLEKAEGKVLVVSDIKKDLGYRMASGHRRWRNICHRLKDARIVEECSTLINNKEVNCLRLLRSFSLSHFELKHRGRDRDDNDTEQSLNSFNRGQTTEELVELPVLRQVYDMIDAAGSKGLTNTEVCRRLGLRSKEYHVRYFKQMISRFGLHLQLESHNKTEVYRVWTAGNFNLESSNMAPTEKEPVPLEVDASKSLVADFDFVEKSSELKQAQDMSVSARNNTGNNRSENDAAVITEASTGIILDDEGTSNLLLQCDPLRSDEVQSNGLLDEEQLQGMKSVTSTNMLETRSLALISPSRRRPHQMYPRLSICAAGLLREQSILKMLEEEKFLIRPDLHRRLESLEKEKKTEMDRKTLLRILNKLQQEGYCKCIHVSVPVVTNCGRSKTTEVVLHPSVYNVTHELLAQIHDRMRSFEIQLRKQSHVRQKGKSVPILDNVQRIPNSVRPEVQSERVEVMRANGFVYAKMVRTRLLHFFLWDWICSSPGWDDAFLSTNHSCDLKNPHSSCKLFELDLATRSMPLELFLKVVGSYEKIEDVVKECKSGLLLRDLPIEKYKVLMDTRATGRLSWLIDILRRLKLIRLVRKGHAEDGSSNPHTTLTHALELKPYIEEPVSTVASSGFIFPDLRPQVRHDFVLSSRKAVDEYWNTLEYCYAAAKSRAALLAFPGSAVHELFHPRSWASSRVMTDGQRVELLKRVAKDGVKKRLSFSECEKIAEDLNLSLEQVLRVYHDKRQRSLTRLQSVLNAEGQELQTAKGKPTVSSRKRKRVSDRLSSKLVDDRVANAHSSLEAAADPVLDSDNQYTTEQDSLFTTGDYDCQLERKSAGNNEEGPEVLKLNEEDDEVHTFIHKQALSRFNRARQKKFSWTEDADRQLVIGYAMHRAALGAKFHRADWASITNLPASLNSCKRRMSLLNRHTPFREAVMKLCTILSEQYAKYLEKFQIKMLTQGDSGEMVRDSGLTEDRLYSSASMPGKWANFDDNIIKAALDDVLRCKRMDKIEAVRDTFSDQENSEDDDVEDCDRTKASDQTSSPQKLPRKNLKLISKGANVSRQMHDSVAIANAAELFKLIFLSNSTAPEVPTLLAETLRRYSEHDLFAAFNYLREKKIMIGGNNSPFVLSHHFLHSISSSAFPTDTGSRAAKFATWLHEREKDLMEEGIEVPSDLQCGEIFTLCALVSSGEMSITPCLPNEGVGEAEDNRTSKRNCDGSEPDGGELSKKSKTTFAGESELTCRREKGFPGIKLSLQCETISKLLAIDSFKDGNLCLAPIIGGKDQSDSLSGLHVKCGSLHSDVADYVKDILDSGTTFHHALDVGGSPWEAMTSYAEYLLSSCSYEVNTSFLRPHLFKTLYSDIQKSGDNGLSMKEIRKVLNINDEKMLELMIEVLGAFGRALKVNAYDSIRVVDSLYRSKYFLTSVYDRAGHHLKGQKRKFEDKHLPLNFDDHRETFAASEDDININASEVHRVTILNRPVDIADPPTEISTGVETTSSQHSEVVLSKMNRVESFELRSTDSQICRPLMPWMNGDGTINELVYKGLIRCVLGIVVQNPGILEDNIIYQVHGLNPQSTRQLLEMMIMDNHIIMRKLQQMTSAQPPSILANLLGNRFKKPKVITRVHYFANPMSTDSL